MARIDPDTLSRLFDEHGRSLLLFARQWCDATDDIVQDAFVALARQDAVPGQVVPWLYRVVRNGAIAAVRQTSRRRSHSTE
jgi:DNA-directed RNA polymerase specialized sigma24 family protein